MTPGAAEALAVKLYRTVRTTGETPRDALKNALADYQNPIPLDTLRFRIQLAARQASGLEFVPPLFRTVTPG